MNKMLATTFAATLIGLSAPAALAASDAASPEMRPAAGDGTQQESGSVGQYIDDAAITTKVKAALTTDELTRARYIDVETTRGVVTLSGEVDSRAEVERASMVTAGIEGVASINNKLTVRP